MPHEQGSPFKPGNQAASTRPSPGTSGQFSSRPAKPTNKSVVATLPGKMTATRTRKRLSSTAPPMSSSRSRTSTTRMIHSGRRPTRNRPHTPEIMRMRSTAGSSSWPRRDTAFVRRAICPSIQSVPAASAYSSVAATLKPLRSSTRKTGTRHSLTNEMMFGTVKMRSLTWSAAQPSSFCPIRASFPSAPSLDAKTGPCARAR